MARDLWNQEPMTEVVLDVSGGVNSGDEDYILNANQLSYLKNGNLDTTGKRIKRTGVLSILAPGVVADALGGWVDSAGNHYLTGIWDGELWKTDGVGTWTLAATTSISAYTAVTHDITFGRAYSTTGSSAVTYSHTVAIVYPLTPFSGANYERACLVSDDMKLTELAYHFRTACWWQGRLWAANFSDDGYYADTLAWSNIWDASTFDLATNNIRVDPDKGDEITRIMPTRSSTPRLYILKRDSVHALDVVWAGGVTVPATENTLDTTESQLVTLSSSSGCVAPMTAVYSSGNEKSDIFFLSRDGLRSMARVEQDTSGGAGVPVSQPVQDVIDRINWAHAVAAWATVFDQKLFLALPVDGATAPNLIIIYDVEKNRWVGEYSFVPIRSTVFDLANSPRYMYGVVGSAVTDVPYFTTNPTYCSHLYQLHKDDWYTDGAYSAVAYEEITRGLTFGEYGVKKRWNWVEVLMEPAVTAATLGVYVKVDELDWAIVDYISMEPEYEYPILPARLPWIFTQARPAFHKLDLSDTPPGQKIQIKLTCDSPAPTEIRATRVSAWLYEEAWE